MGFNGVRKHQKVEDPRWYALCDRLGLLVWGEMGNAWEFTPEAQDALRQVLDDNSLADLVTRKEKEAATQNASA